MAEETGAPRMPAAPPPILDRWLVPFVIANAVLAALLVVLIVTAGRSAEAVVSAFGALVILAVLAQLLAGLVALFYRGVRWKGALALVTVPAMWFAVLVAAFAGMGWGRPLRVRGRQVFPSLTRGADWTQGERPSAAGLDAATRAALEALWLHDAQKEHASVPAFARISWLLAAVGAPAELMAWSQRAALEEVDHARRCFALAAGYGGRTHSVEAMPDLLLAGLELRGDPLAVLAVESLQDGCLLEDFNADVAAACAEACVEPVTRKVLEQIAREERSHAEFSWAVLAWALERGPQAVGAAVERAAAALDQVRRPRAVGAKHWLLVVQADAQALLRHGRIPDARLALLWRRRLAATRERLAELPLHTSSHSLRM
jgi:hypothetical protein